VTEDRPILSAEECNPETLVSGSVRLCRNSQGFLKQDCETCQNICRCHKKAKSFYIGILHQFCVSLIQGTTVMLLNCCIVLQPVLEAFRTWLVASMQKTLDWLKNHAIHTRDNLWDSVQHF